MIPDYCEALTAYRAFDVCDNGLLVGQAQAEPWPPYEPFAARCGMISNGKGASAHVVDGRFVLAPVYRCDCGIHVLKSADAAKQRIVDEKSSHSAGWISVSFGNHERVKGRAWGTVKIWGRVIEHQIGYRAEFAYPSSLTCESAELAAKIAALYGIPCGVEAIPIPKRKSIFDDLGSGGVSSYYVSAPLYYSAPKSWLMSSGDDADDCPMITPAPATPRIIAPPAVVGANRWQTRQYANTLTPKQVQLADWRSILRKGLFLSGVSA